MVATKYLREAELEFDLPFEKLPGFGLIRRVKVDGIEQWSRKVIKEYKNGDQEVEYIIRGREIDNDKIFDES